MRRRCWTGCAARPPWWGPSVPGRRQETPSGGRSSPKPSTPSPATSRGKPAWRRASWRMSCGGSCATGRPSAGTRGGTRGGRGKARSPPPPGCSTPSSTSTPTPWTTTPSRWCSPGSAATRRAHGRCPPSCPSCWSTTTMSRPIRTTGGTSSNTARRPTVCFGTPRRRTAWATSTSGRSTCSSCSGSRASPTSRSPATCSSRSWWTRSCWSSNTRSTRGTWAEGPSTSSSTSTTTRWTPAARAWWWTGITRSAARPERRYCTM